MKLLVCTQMVDSKDPNLGFFHRWLEEFAKHCDEVIVICLKEGEHNLPKNVLVRSLGKEKKESRIKYLFRFYYYVLRYFFRYKGVFIHMNSEYAILGWLIWKLGGKRRVLWYTHKKTSIRLRIGSRLVNAICTASPESFRLKRKNVVVTGHGIDVVRFSIPRGKEADYARLVTVGRISRSKGLDILLDSVALLPKHGVPFRFSMVGASITRDDERYQEELFDKMDQRGISSFAGFTGAKTLQEIPVILSTSDMFLHASRTGSLDKAPLEAMAAGCIVISSNDAVKPILRMIQDGIAVERPEPELFAQTIQRVRELDELTVEKVRERGRDMVKEKHSLDALVKKIIWIFQGNK